MQSAVQNDKQTNKIPAHGNAARPGQGRTRQEKTRQDKMQGETTIPIDADSNAE
jgi:hypothetical protein